jgi:hypothetical protein
VCRNIVNTTVLSFARGFEDLLDLPDDAPRKHSKALVKKHCSRPGARSYAYKSDRHGRRVGDVGTLPEIWADRFYVLRNRIIHGDVIRPQDYDYTGQSHVYFAMWFFLLALKGLLNEQWRRRSFHDQIDRKSGAFHYNATSGEFEERFKRASRRRRTRGPDDRALP